MKLNFLKIGFYATMFAMTLFVTACGGGTDSHDGHDHDHDHQHEQGQQHDHDHDHEGHQHEQGEQHEGQEESSIDKTGKEYTSAYICPMHCEGSGSDKEGKCPACKMDYEKNEEQIE